MNYGSYNLSPILTLVKEIERERSEKEREGERERGE